MYEVDTIELKKKMIDSNLEKIVDLSAISGVDRNTLSRVLNKEMKPSTYVIEKLMQALNITSTEAGKIFFKPKLTECVSLDNEGR